MPYTSDQLRAAYRAAEAAGDTQARDTLLSAFINQRVSEQRASGEITAPDPTEGMSGIDKFRAGIGQGMTNVARHAGNLISLVGDDDIAQAKKLDAPLLDTGAGKVGSFVGEMAATAPLGLGVGAASKTALLGKALGGAVRRGAAEGAAQGYLMGDPGQRGSMAGLGAAAGSIIPGVGKFAGKLARGVTRTPEAQTLLNAGVDLTPGQMNPRGVLNRMEQAAEGTFGIGDVVQNSRENAMRGYNRAMVESAAAPGEKLASQGDFNSLIDEAAEGFERAYDPAKGFPVGAKVIPDVGPDIPLSKLFDSVVGKPRLGLTKQIREGVGEQLKDELNEMIQAARRRGAGLMSDDLLGFRSMIRQAARDEAGDTAESRARRQLLQAAEGKVTDALESQIPKETAEQLRAVDRQYAKFAIVKNVANKAKDKEPTPFQMSQAIAQATDNNSYARGGGLNRDLSKAARETFQSNVPRTGLTGLGRLAAPAALAVSQPQFTLPVLGTALGMVGTKTGRKLAAGATRPQLLAQALLGRAAESPDAVRNLLALYLRRAGTTAALPAP